MSCASKIFLKNTGNPKKLVEDAPWLRSADGVEIKFQDSSDTLVARCHIVDGRAVWGEGES